ncbi:sigma factor-like helix-turn-helix DNA-binding protein [Micromonospora sp. NPDC048835]|uniref:RNA polymerase sigma factor n=1 Tax=Micromonospora sp. NPDC048835 TaxID=3155147 RepID=UPI0033D4B22D
MVPLDVLADLAPQLADETRRVQENLDRRMADRQLVRELAASDFTGPRYRRFEEELARYGLSVLHGWMYTGFIFHLTAARGFPLHPSDAELEELSGDVDARDELAIMTVALALLHFREKALIGQGWRFEAGAGLATYFMGTCLSVFPNELRKRRNQHKRWRLQDTGDPALSRRQQDVISDPGVLAVGNIRVWEYLKRVDERTRAILALTIDGYSQEEIAQLLGTSVRAVEGVLHRWRNREKANQQWGGEPDGKP